MKRRCQSFHRRQREGKAEEEGRGRNTIEGRRWYRYHGSSPCCLQGEPSPAVFQRFPWEEGRFTLGDQRQGRHEDLYERVICGVLLKTEEGCGKQEGIGKRRAFEHKRLGRGEKDQRV